MNTIHLLAAVAALGTTACQRPATSALIEANRETRGTLPAQPSVTLDGSNSNVRLVVGEAADSVRWSLITDPAGCATVRLTPAALRVERVTRKCAATWEVAVPTVKHIDVSAGVGNIALVIHDSRAVELTASVGRVAMQIDGRAIVAPRSPGSGDRLAWGEKGADAHISARTGVGSVKAEVHTVTSRVSR